MIFFYTPKVPDNINKKWKLELCFSMTTRKGGMKMKRTGLMVCIIIFTAFISSASRAGSIEYITEDFCTGWEWAPWGATPNNISCEPGAGPNGNTALKIRRYPDHSKNRFSIPLIGKKIELTAIVKVPQDSVFILRLGEAPEDPEDFWSGSRANLFTTVGSRWGYQGSPSRFSDIPNTGDWTHIRMVINYNPPESTWNGWINGEPLNFPGSVGTELPITGKPLGGGIGQLAIELHNYASHAWVSDLKISVLEEYDLKCELKASLPEEMVHQNTVAVNGKVYAISKDAATNNISLMFVYDPIADVWTKKPTPPTNDRYGMASAVYHDDIYLIGGVEHGSPLGTVSIYNVKDDEWRSGPSMPYASALTTASIVNDQIYVIGGTSPVFGSSAGSDLVQIYDLKSGIWTVGKENMPTKRQAAAATVIGNKIYVMGGYVCSSSGCTKYDNLEVYDTTEKRWLVETDPMPMLRPTYYPMAVTMNNKIYAFGGSSLSGMLDTVQVYNPQINTWQDDTAMPLPGTAFSDSSDSIIDGTIYVVGLMETNGEYTGVAACYEANKPPVAQCQDVTAEADEQCTACASIDDGSYDPDGHSITIIEDPGCDYPLGETSVDLTITDELLASDTCSATITVLDTSPPNIIMDVPETITPPDAPVSFTATVEDNCGATVAISGYDCYKFTKKGKRIDKTESCVVSTKSGTVTIVDSGGVGTFIEWTITATDTSGNSTTETKKIEVVNPGKRKGKGEEPPENPASDPV